jgi:16S rRNA (cytidine1402-2'-O)-methyltransferase
MSGRLFVVSTPIGNLEDVTLRALRILREADVIAAEDTRRTARLLHHHGIDTPMVSLHAHNERRAGPRLLAQLQHGASVALVTDAGTPLVSDPGLDFVCAAREAGIRVEAIPGPSAVLAALVTSGFSTDQFSFLGFPPVRGKARKRWLDLLASERRTAIFFEAPHRIALSLADVGRVLPGCQIAICRELTKVHEELVIGPIETVLQSEAVQKPAGEFTLVVDLAGYAEARQAAELPAPVDDHTIAAEFGRITQLNGLTRRAAVSQVARRFGISSGDAYAAIERAKEASRRG